MSPPKLDPDAPLHAVRAILLDLGNVLIRVDFERTLAAWARAAGLAEEVLASRFVADEAYQRHERGELEFEAYAPRLRELIGVDLDVAALLDGWNAALGEAMPGALELVSTLAAERPVYAFSNSNAEHHALWSRDHAALLAPMREVFVSHRIGARKPDREAFSRVVSRIGLEPEQVAFFDDLAENVKGARRAGLLAWRVTGPADVGRVLGVSVES